ncbi:MAG: alpha/beta fold hydrolase [Variovorax sp.]|nr:MAG: alpha/beta fold hydrolase [Variovorax sp.]
MIPLLFGPEARRLFGLYHPPEGASLPAAPAILLCAPFGHEAIRTHRFYRLLAQRLARQGHAVLRFDVYGTGDSPGDDEDLDLDGWRGDIVEAHRELLRRSGAVQAVWFGARLGATLALQAAATATPMARKLVLWEPVLDGAAYLAGLRQRHVEEIELSHVIPDAAWRRDLAQDPEAFTNESMGFALTTTLRQQIRVLAPAVLQAPPGVDLTVIGAPEDTAMATWTAHLTSLHRAARWTPLRHSLHWTSNPFPNNEMVPADALRCVVAEIHEASD